MAFFDKVKEKAAQAADKAKDLGEMGKIKVEIAKAENEIKKLEETICKDIFANHSDFVSENYAEESSKIAEIRKTIEGFTAQIEELKASKPEAAAEEEK